MKLKELIDFEKTLLKESTATSAVGGFVGSSGNLVDQKFGGPFHREFGKLEDLLNQQIDGDIEKRMYTDDNTPFIDPDFYEVDWKYEYDEYVKQDNSKFKSDSETEMQIVNLDIKYDEIIDNTEENKKFINDTNDWKSIYDDKKY